MEINNKKVYNELYNYVPPVINGGANNVRGFNPFSPIKKEESNLINNMLKNRTITFTKDIFDSSGKVWKQEGETIKGGLGNPGTGTWEIQKDGIKRDSNNNLMSLNFDIPTGGMDWYPFPMRQGVYAKTSVALKPEDFVIEDDSNYSGVGYRTVPQGRASYNIYNNLYELIQK